MTRTVTLKELRPKLPGIMNGVESRMDRVIITKRGKPLAMMMSIEDYESLLETLAILSDPGLAKKVKQAESDIKAGRVKSLAKIEKELGLA
jgi:antitoxin YefM